jgi:nicotinate-nucleotide pyrophosphorylase (carboxylating)
LRPEQIQPNERLPGAGLILLDNMNLTDLRASVRHARQYSQAQLEASGRLHLDAARAVAGTGVDYIAVGALPTQAPPSTSDWTR